METEKDFDYPTRNEDNKWLANLYDFMEKNYPSVGSKLDGIRLTDFSYRKRVDYTGKASMDPMDYMNINEFKSDLHQKIETVHPKIENLDNLYNSLNSTIDEKVKQPHYKEDETIKKFYNLPKMNGLTMQNTPLLQADALKMTDKTMMKKNFRYEEKVAKGEVDEDDPYAAFKKNEEDEYEAHRNKLISAFSMGSAAPSSIPHSSQPASSSHTPMDIDDDTVSTEIVEHTPVKSKFNTKNLFDRKNVLRKSEIVVELEKELDEFVNRPRKDRPKRDNGDDVDVILPNKKTMDKNNKTKITAETIELEKEESRYSKYHSDLLKQKITDNLSTIKPTRKISELSDFSNIMPSEEIRRQQESFINQRNLLIVPKKKSTFIEDIDNNENVKKLRDDVFDDISTIQENTDAIPIGQRNISLFQAKVKEYVLFYRNHLNNSNYKLHRIDKHGTEIFNYILDLFKEPSLKGDEKLIDAYKLVKPFLSRKKAFV